MRIRILNTVGRGYVNLWYDGEAGAELVESQPTHIHAVNDDAPGHWLCNIQQPSGQQARNYVYIRVQHQLSIHMLVPDHDKKKIIIT